MICERFSYKRELTRNGGKNGGSGIGGRRSCGLGGVGGGRNCRR